MRLGARRAFVLELTGTPKAGKTSVLTTLQAFFKEAGLRVSILKERATECPLAMKGHFFFNAWTMSTMLAEVLANLETDADLLLLDRGFLDALIWLELQSARQQVSDEERATFTDFVLLPRWRSLIDYTIIMKADPAVAIVRENHALLIARKGSLMNEPALTEFNAAIDRTTAAQRDNFNFTTIDTSDSTNVKDSCVQVLRTVLPVLQAWADPEVTVIKRSDLERVFASRRFIDRSDATEALQRLSEVSFLVHRVAAEDNPDYLQLVVGGIPVRTNGDILVFRRDLNDAKSISYGRTTLWRGCHVQLKPDALSDTNLAEALTARLHQDLHIKSDLSPELIGLAAPMPEESAHAARHHHIGILYRVRLPDPVAHNLHEKTFRRSGRAHPFTGNFRPQKKIIDQLDDPNDELQLEPWSKHLVRNVKLDA